jgi:hypothetical protein
MLKVFADNFIRAYEILAFDLAGGALTYIGEGIPANTPADLKRLEASKPLTAEVVWGFALDWYMDWEVRFILLEV